MRRLLILVPLLLAACGGGSADERAIKDLFTKSAHAAADGDAQGYCALYTQAAQQQLAKLLRSPDCVSGFKANFHNATAADKRALKNFKVTSVKIDGNTAKVLTTLNPKAPGLAVKQNGQWKLELSP
jgi:hypothetical protein